MAENGQYGRNM